MLKTKSVKSPTKLPVKKTATKTQSPKGMDPLYVIFEQHLFNFVDPDSDRQTFISNVVAEYLTYLRKSNVIVPKSLEQPVVEELSTQVHTMLVKKIYGCLPVNEFIDPKIFKKRSRRPVRKVERKVG